MHPPTHGELQAGKDAKAEDRVHDAHHRKAQHLMVEDTQNALSPVQRPTRRRTMKFGRCLTSS